MADQPHSITLDQLESRQDEVIQQLDELNSRIEKTIAECLARGDIAA